MPDFSLTLKNKPKTKCIQPIFSFKTHAFIKKTPPVTEYKTSYTKTIVNFGTFLFEIDHQHSNSFWNYKQV